MVKYTRCSVYGCGVRNLQFFHFPRNVQRAEKWRELAGNPNLYSIPLDKLHHKASVCKRHFTRDQFTNTKLDRLNLNAFPSLFLPSSATVRSTPDHTVSVTPPPLLHYVVFPSAVVQPPVTAPSIQLTTVNNACGMTTAPPEMDLDGEPYECQGESGCAATVGSQVPTSFAVLTEFCESENGVALKDTVEEGSDVPFDGNYRYTLCRLCFSTLDVITTDIFSVDNGCGYVIKDAIEDLLQFKVSKVDEYPQFICISCLTKLNEFREFKEKILKDKAVFEEALRKLKSSDVEGTLTNGSAEDSSGHEEMSPNNMIQLISFESGVEDISVGASPEVTKDDQVEENEDLTEKRRLVEEYSNLISETSRDYGQTEHVGEADQITSEFEELLVGAELQIKREVNIVGLEEPDGCQDCGRWFKNLNHLAKPKKEHRKAMLSSAECHFCGKRFRQQGDLKRHLISSHSDWMSDGCARCGVTVRLPEDHKTCGTLLCAVCRRALAEDQRQENRSGGTHSRAKVHAEGSNREFNVDILVMKDIRSQGRGKGTFVCGVCDESFAMSEALDQHLKLSHVRGKCFRCQHCNARFPLKRCLLKHMKLHLMRQMS